MAELVCPVHGPYDASYGNCPYCSGAAMRPPKPAPLAEDEMPTGLGVDERGYAGVEDWEEEAPTIVSSSRQRGGFLDIDDDEPTQIGHFGGLDVTELDASVAEEGLLGILWVKEGRRRGKIYKIKDGTVVGRSQGNLMLDDPKVSNPHAKFTEENGQFVLWDFGSKNGTYVNGERIRAATPLKENDLIKMGETIFILKTLEG